MYSTQLFAANKENDLLKKKVENLLQTNHRYIVHSVTLYVIQYRTIGDEYRPRKLIQVLCYLNILSQSSCIHVRCFNKKFQNTEWMTSFKRVSVIYKNQSFLTILGLNFTYRYTNFLWRYFVFWFLHRLSRQTEKLQISLNHNSEEKKKLSKEFKVRVYV